jgi:hypothetical protein
MTISILVWARATYEYLYERIMVWIGRKKVAMVGVHKYVRKIVLWFLRGFTLPKPGF